MKLTVFTPAYNRADKLNKLYNSLKNQNSTDFEWLIIDDGSNDNTRNIVNGFITDSELKIRYYYQNNGGKHRAYNHALDKAQGDYFICVDSDDYLVDGAVDKIISYMEAAQGNAIVAAYKADDRGNILSDRFPEKVQDITWSELGTVYNCSGEFTLIFNTAFAKSYRFPEFEGENFMTEAVVYDKMSSNAELHLVPEIITICEYYDDGLTRSANRLMKNNPAGYCLYFMQRIDIDKGNIQKLITAGKYHCFRLLAGSKAVNYTGKNNTLVKLCKPVGLCFLLYYRLIRF